jgi:ribosomal silencing factor RsfS
MRILSLLLRRTQGLSAATRARLRRRSLPPQLATVSLRCLSSKDKILAFEEEARHTEWIPPSRPLAGDQGQTHLYERSLQKDEDDVEEDDSEEAELRKIEEELKRLEEFAQRQVAVDEDTSVDWLQTRRAKLGHEGIDMMQPEEASKRKHEMSDIPVKERTLLSAKEISFCLTSLGGEDVFVLPPQSDQQGRMLVTASSSHHLRSLAELLVRQLRRRNLHKFGVIGAELGPEGSDDPDETWLVVDCENYVVHLLDETTRRALNLEALWTGKDGLHRLNALDEEAVEDYVAANPVPRRLPQ